MLFPLDVSFPIVPVVLFHSFDMDRVNAESG